MSKPHLFPSLVFTSGVIAVACAAAGKPPRPPSELERFKQGEVSEPAIAIVNPGPDSDVHGAVRLVSDSDGVRVIARLEGLEPNSVHGFHIHQYGDCSDPGFKTAGDHFNPEGTRHGSPDSAEHHSGDLGNITAGPDGVALYEKVIPGLAAPRELAGRAIIVHQSPDDLKSQPAGNAGARLACGVIGIAHR